MIEHRSDRRCGRARSVIVVAATLALVAAGIATGADRVAFTAKDQAAAKKIVLTNGDLRGVGWKGGPKKPDLKPDYTCVDYDPKQTVVTTGAAESDFSAGLDEVDVEADILQTPEMVLLDWKRSVRVPGLLPCLRGTFAKGLPAGEKLVSIVKLPFPHVAPMTAVFRVLIDATVKEGDTLRLYFDVVLVGRGRTEITLFRSGLAAAASKDKPDEIRLVRLLASRAVM